MSFVNELVDINDSRVLTFAKYVLISLNQKPDKWNKMYSNEKVKELIDSFLDRDVSLITFSMSSNGVLQVKK